MIKRLLLLVLALACVACTSKTSSSTTSGAPVRPTPLPTAGANVIFNNCGDAKFVSPSPVITRITAGPHATAGGTVALPPVTQSEILTYVHSQLLLQPLASDSVQCSAHEMAVSQLSGFAAFPSTATQTWVVVAKVTSEASQTPTPQDGGQLPSGREGGEYYIYFCSASNPPSIYGITTYPLNTPLPSPLSFP